MSLVQKQADFSGQDRYEDCGRSILAGKGSRRKDHFAWYGVIGAGVATLALLVLLPVALLSMGPPARKTKPAPTVEVVQAPPVPVEPQPVSTVLVSSRPVEPEKQLTVVETGTREETPTQEPGFAVTPPPAEFALLESQSKKPAVETQFTQPEWIKKYYTLPDVPEPQAVQYSSRKATSSSFIPAQPLPGQGYTNWTQGTTNYGMTVVTQVVQTPVFVPVTQYVPVPVPIAVPVPQYIPYQQNTAMTMWVPGSGIFPNRFTVPHPSGVPGMNLTVPGYGGKPVLALNGGGGNKFHLTVPGHGFNQHNLTVPHFGGGNQNMVVTANGGNHHFTIPSWGFGKQTVMTPPPGGGHHNLTVPGGGHHNLTIPGMGGHQNLTIPGWGGGKQTVMTPPPFGGQGNLVIPNMGMGKINLTSLTIPGGSGGKQNLNLPSPCGCKQTIFINFGGGGHNHLSIPKHGPTGGFGGGCAKR